MNVVVLMDVSNTTRVIPIPCSTPDLETVGLVNPQWLCMFILAVSNIHTHYNTYPSTEFRAWQLPYQDSLNGL
jgi:hypothetical protein